MKIKNKKKYKCDSTEERKNLEILFLGILTESIRICEKKK